LHCKYGFPSGQQSLQTKQGRTLLLRCGNHSRQHKENACDISQQNSPTNSVCCPGAGPAKNRRRGRSSIRNKPPALTSVLRIHAQRGVRRWCTSFSATARSGQTTHVWKLHAGDAIRRPHCYDEVSASRTHFWAHGVRQSPLRWAHGTWAMATTKAQLANVIELLEC